MEEITPRLEIVECAVVQADALYRSWSLAESGFLSFVAMIPWKGREQIMNLKITLLGVLIAFAAIRAHADSWATFSNHSMLKNHVIVDVGDVSQVEPPFNTKWKEDVYQMNGRCFSISGHLGYWGYGSKAALLVANAQKILKLALIESSIGSVKVDLQSIDVIECPTGTNVMPYSDDLKEQLRLLKKRQEELRKKADEYRKKAEELQKQR